MSIKEHLQTVESPCGDLTMIAIARKNRPAGLPKPYEYLAARSDFLAFKDRYIAFASEESGKHQYCSIDVKHTSKGVRFSLFVLSSTAGAYSGFTGVDRAGWSRVKRAVETMLQTWLGKDARVYCARYAKTGKLTLKYNAYVAFDDRVCLTKRIKT